MVSSAGQNTISRKGMASLSIPVPDLREQTEIVRILDDLLAKEQQAKEAAEAVLEQIDLMKNPSSPVLFVASSAPTIPLRRVLWSW